MGSEFSDRRVVIPSPLSRSPLWLWMFTCLGTMDVRRGVPQPSRWAFRLSRHRVPFGYPLQPSIYTIYQHPPLPVKGWLRFLRSKPPHPFRRGHGWFVASLKPPIPIGTDRREFTAVGTFDPLLATLGSVFDGVGGLTFWALVFHVVINPEALYFQASTHCRL